jgi:hypothetical protein
MFNYILVGKNAIAFESDADEPLADARGSDTFHPYKTGTPFFQKAKNKVSPEIYNS